MEKAKEREQRAALSVTTAIVMGTSQEIADNPKEEPKEDPKEAPKEDLGYVTIATNQDTLPETAELPKEQAKEG